MLYAPALPRASTLRYFFKGQLLHLFSLLILLALAYAFAAPALGTGAWFGISDVVLFWLSVGVAIMHQVIVWVVFRLQLGWITLSRRLGKWDILFWGALFTPFLLARPVLMVFLGLSNRDTLKLPASASYLMGVVFLIPALYTVWSTFRYFGFVRAMGGDHFRTVYRQMPLVRKGAFHFSSNAMYAFGFLMLWSIALMLRSQAALSAAIFQHAYIWVHFYCTERPDMELMYSHKTVARGEK